MHSFQRTTLLSTLAHFMPRSRPTVSSAAVSMSLPSTPFFRPVFVDLLDVVDVKALVAADDAEAVGEALRADVLRQREQQPVSGTAG